MFLYCVLLGINYQLGYTMLLLPPRRDRLMVRVICQLHLWNLLSLEDTKKKIRGEQGCETFTCHCILTFFGAHSCIWWFNGSRDWEGSSFSVTFPHDDHWLPLKENLLLSLFYYFYEYEKRECLFLEIWFCLFPRRLCLTMCLFSLRLNQCNGNQLGATNVMELHSHFLLSLCILRSI